VRDYRPDQPRGGTLIVQGTSAMVSVIKVLPELDQRGLNVKIVCATSPQLFALQPEEYRRQVLSPADRVNSTVITTQARWLMHDWLFNQVAEEYALSADWDNRWRTGGTLDEVIDEAHLSPRWVLEGIERFVQDRDTRLARFQAQIVEGENTMSQYPSEGSYGVSGYQAQPPTNTRATISLIAGTLGLVFGLLSFCVVGACSLVFTVTGAIVGLVLGYQARREIAESGGTESGEGLATAGIVLGWINAGVTLLLVVFLILAVVGIVGLGFLGEWNY
jgi:hypothetical protein